MKSIFKKTDSVRKSLHKIRPHEMKRPAGLPASCRPFDPLAYFAAREVLG